MAQAKLLRRMTRRISLVLVGLAAIAGMSALVAQTIEGLDPATVKQRAADQAREAETLAEQVRHRGDAFRDEAQAVTDGAPAGLRRAAANGSAATQGQAIDFDTIVAGAADNAAHHRGQAPQLVVFASLSMPAPSLKALIADTARARGVVVFRGFPNNSARAFAASLGQVVARENETAHIGVDPRLFRAFAVETVPTFVAVASDFDLCDGFQCRTAVPPHDRMSGNVTLRYALDTFADGGGPGAAVARVGLASLDRATR